MECTCGNISRFEVFRLELKRLVLDWHPVNMGKTVPNVVEHQRVIETGRPVIIRCIRCGKFGLPEYASYKEEDEDLMKPESREGHDLPPGLPEGLPNRSGDTLGWSA